MKESKQGKLERGMVKITGAFKLFGEYDAILRFEVEDPAHHESVMNALANRVCRIPGVQDTRTYLAVPFPAS